MSRHARFALVAVAATSLAAVAPAAAEDDGPARGLEPGPWWASGEASGTATVSQQGVTITWTGSIPAQFDFVITGDSEDGPFTASGQWEHQGDAIMTVGGSGGSAVGVLSFDGGGSVTGSDTELRLSGTSSTTGTVTAGPSSFPVSNTSALPPLTVDVRAVDCNEAYGEWVFTVEQAFQNEGFSASFTGFWIGFRDQQGIDDEIAAIMEQFGASPDGTPSDITSRSALVGMSATLLSEFNAFVDDFPAGWSVDRVLDMAGRTEGLLNGWRNLSDCARELFGADNVETFVNGLTLVIQGLITGAAGSADSATWTQLAHLGARTGAFGPGAANPARAVVAEQALIDAAEAILEANVDPADGKILVNDDTTRVMATGAAMGWNYSVNGEFLDAAATYTETFGSEAPPIGEGDGS